MNERVAAVGNQFKDALGKLKNAWTELEATRKRMIIILVAALIVVAIVLVVILNAVNSRYIVLYAGLPQEESVAGLTALEEAGLPGRINDDGELEVPARNENASMATLATVGIPGAVLDYSLLQQASGLTMTDAEKRQYMKLQDESSLSAIIKTFPGVRDAFVNIHKDDNANKVWNAGSANNTASVKVTMNDGANLTPDQVAAIRHLVGPAQGIDSKNVTVLSGETVLAASGEDYTIMDATAQFLQRQGIQESIEEQLHNKTANVLRLGYPDATDYSITPSVELDWDAMLTEAMEYLPLEGTDHGVVQHEEQQALMGTGQYAEGVVGEDQNTDIPYYADLDGDGEWDAVDYYQTRDYLVSYTKQQIEKDGPKIAKSSIAVQVSGNITNDIRQMYRENISDATGVAIEDITFSGIPVPGTGVEPEEPSVGTIIPWIPDNYLYIAALAIVVLIIALIVIMILRRRARKKKLAAEAAALEAEEAEALRIQQEIEERKRQLKDAAIADQGEDAITEEVRDFARHNPEITANLLRNWLKEGD